MSAGQSLPPEYKHRVLIVEDEDDWIKTMTYALKDAQRDDVTRPQLKVDVAKNAREAKRLLALGHYHVISLDMRLPEGEQEERTVTSGIELAQELIQPLVSPVKTIVYTATLAQEDPKSVSAEGVTVVDRLPIIDKYAKSAGGPPTPGAAFETLRQKDWAKRVLDYLTVDQLVLPNAPEHGNDARSRETAVGAWLSGAIRSLPPLLAQHAQELKTHWPEEGRKVDARAVDAAIKFIETTLRLAVAQTAVLLGTTQSKFAGDLPSDDTLAQAIERLRSWLRKESAALAAWSWRAHLSDAAVDAFDQARLQRNKTRHTLGSNKSREDWQALRVPLRHAMDVASYWPKHPLCTDLRYGAGGWRGELLVGTAYPRPLRDLPQRDFPGAAVSGYWQTAIRHDDPDGVGWRAEAVCWEDWLAADPRQERRLWLKTSLGGQGRMPQAIDLERGDNGVFPSGRR